MPGRFPDALHCFHCFFQSSFSKPTVLELVQQSDLAGYGGQASSLKFCEGNLAFPRAISILSYTQSIDPMDLQTQRIILRTPIPDDDETLVSHYTDPKTMHHLQVLLNQPWDAPRMAARREAYAQNELQGRARNFTVVLKATPGEAVIGQAGYRSLWRDESLKRGELGVLLAHAQHGRGLVWDVHLLLLTLGFEELGLEMVEWVTAEQNEGMRAVLRRMGCKEAGVLEEAGWGKQIKYSLEKQNWPDCKVWLCARVAASEESIALVATS